MSSAGQEPAFAMSGRFEDAFADKHNTAGTFTINVFKTNALIDMTFENGFREVVGTDGHDSFYYIPFTGNRAILTNSNGQAIISHGRFPQDANEIVQFLWLIFTHDPDLIANLGAYRFPFYGAYTTNDIIVKIITNSVTPNPVTSIKWFAPNYASGTNHYKLTEYTNGYLRAELTVIRTNSVDNAIIPAEVTFSQFNTQPTDPNMMSNYLANMSKHIAVRIPPKSPNDVVPVEYALFSITNIRIISPLASYIPEIPDKTARVNDRRFPDMGVVSVVDSGKWWNAREIFKRHELSTKPRRWIVLVVLLVTTVFPICLLFRYRRAADSRTNK